MSDMECGVRSRQRELLTVSVSDNYCELYSDAVTLTVIAIWYALSVKMYMHAK